MADVKPTEINNEDVQNYTVSSTNDPKNMQELTQYVSDKFQTMSDQIINRIDEMGNRIDDLEKNIADLMTQAGVEGPDK
ncbi:heat shock factor-binding protein 1 isoform X2 [Chrysoperla carnea]|uniref:heat shock factor-binding protein 1 isoform X2 n=1 Tax=Chrysoperla carnea TaxID=189513 RepID=UPI001D05E47E|nr:heat shock factor-binding protein 1 isoform X2 [Chrysoperla carnea]